jgi:RNA polymerase sigma-70 factor (ECF subfamily)
MLRGIDDSELAGRALGGDREAFRRLVERHYDFVFRLARRQLGSAADAEDVAQDVCLALVQKLGQFRGRSRFTTWLASIVINQCRDFARRRRSSQGLVEKYGVLRAMDEADAADTRERTSWLEAALASLDPGLRETVLLVVGEDMSHAEAAEALGCAESTVSWRMHMAKKRLRERVGLDDD